MKVIWKYPLPCLGGEFNLILPAKSKILTVHIQRGVPTIWVLVDTASIPEEDIRIFYIALTGGSPFNPENWEYIGTFFLDEESFIGHLFEMK